MVSLWQFVFSVLRFCYLDVFMFHVTSTCQFGGTRQLAGQVGREWPNAHNDVVTNSAWRRCQKKCLQNQWLPCRILGIQFENLCSHPIMWFSEHVRGRQHTLCCGTEPLQIQSQIQGAFNLIEFQAIERFQWLHFIPQVTWQVWLVSCFDVWLLFYFSFAWRFRWFSLHFCSGHFHPS